MTASALGPFKSPGKPKNLHVETLRGLACIFLVYYHVLGTDGGGISLLASGTGYMHAADSMLFVRMPLFTFISGFLYGLRPVTAATAVPFMRSKFLRLYLPLLFVAIPYAYLQLLAPGVSRRPDGWLAPLTAAVLPSNHFWFLQALLLILLVVTLLESAALMATARRFAIVFAGAAALFVSDLLAQQHFFSMHGAVYLAPFFLLGTALVRFPALRTPRVQGAMLVVLVVCVAWHQQALLGLLPTNLSRTSALSLVYGVAACYMLYVLPIESRVLAWVGHYSFTIFLFHMLATTVTRNALHKVGGMPVEVYVLACTLAGLLVPVLMDRVLDRHRWSRFLMLGRPLRPRRQAKPAPDAGVAEPAPASATGT